MSADPAFDVVIIGGGVVGSAVAYFLSADPGFAGTVAVIERDPAYRIASSSLSTSAIRQQFGTAPNIAMSAFSMDFLREVPERLAVDDEPAAISLHEPGYLILGTSAQIPGFQARHQVQREAGVAVELIGPNAMAARFPWLNVDGLGIGSLGLDKEGWFDGPALLAAYRRKARAQGVTYIPASVTALETTPGRIDAVHLDTGERLRAGTVVNAAGAWSGAVARLAGLDVPVVPRRRSIFVFDSPEKLPHAPFIFDTSGFVFRPEGHLYICGTVPRTENADDDFGLDVDHAEFDDILWPALAHRIPGFERLRMLRAWSGLYDYNLFDHSGIIGRHPDIPNFVLACGFSGHGMMHSPATGAATAELIAHNAFRSLDLSAFAFERIAERTARSPSTSTDPAPARAMGGWDSDPPRPTPAPGTILASLGAPATRKNHGWTSCHLIPRTPPRPAARPSPPSPCSPAPAPPPPSPPGTTSSWSA